MPRSNRPRRRGRSRRPDPEAPTLDEGRVFSGIERIERHADGSWFVRRIPGPATVKAYRCPGCDQEVVPGTPHVVAWPADGPIAGFGDVTDRRHWHTPCWTARDRRGPRR